MARPTKYDPQYHPKHAYNYCLMGATNEEMAAFFEVAVSTVDLWISKHSEFSGAVTRARTQADATVVERTFTRACGFEIETEKVFCTRNGDIVRAATKTYYPPDMTAATFWLKNRQPAKWRDKTVQAHELTDGAAFGVVNIRSSQPTDGPDSAS